MGIVRELCDNESTDWLKLFLDGVVGDTQRKTLVHDRENACWALIAQGGGKVETAWTGSTWSDWTMYHAVFISPPVICQCVEHACYIKVTR